ncbi:MAG: hypothetical protein AAF939_00465 [Planctomycetota bacterium]
MDTFLVVVLLIVITAVTALIGFAYHNHVSNQNRIRSQLLDAAQSLNGHYVLTDEGQHPQIVADIEGKRVRISLQPTSVFDIHGSHIVKTRRLNLIADGFDPRFKFTITPRTFSAAANAWIRGEKVETKDPDFNKYFIVTSNRYRDSLDFMICPQLIERIFSVFPFDPAAAKRYIRTVKKTGSKSKGTQSEREPHFFQTRDYLPPFHVNQKSWIAQINRLRFKIAFRNGQSETVILISDTELDDLKDLVFLIVDIHQQLANNVRSLEVAEIKKPAKPI